MSNQHRTVENVRSPPRTRSAVKTQLDQSRSSTQQQPQDGLSSNISKIQRQQATQPSAPPTQHRAASDVEVEVHEDDVCPICQLLLCKPVTTHCNHTMCKSCMATWAEVSISAPSNMTIVSVDEEPRDFDPATGLEARCPMCRTQTTASINETRAGELKSKYPRTYAEREAEEAADDELGESTQTITVYIGNRHELVEPLAGQTHNEHRWTFFVRPSRTDIIEEIHIHLHPTFQQNHIIRTRAPYSIQRLGWGVFTIVADVILKAGYSWVSSDAENSPDGAAKGMLKLEWTLDFGSFDGTGAMGRCRLKVKSDRAWEGEDGEAGRDRREWERVVRQYERDGRYEPD